MTAMDFRHAGNPAPFAVMHAARRDLMSIRVGPRIVLAVTDRLEVTVALPDGSAVIDPSALSAAVSACERFINDRRGMLREHLAELRARGSTHDAGDGEHDTALCEPQLCGQETTR